MLTYCGDRCSDFDIEEVLAAGKKKTEELKEQLKLMAGSSMAGLTAVILPSYTLHTAFIQPLYSLHAAFRLPSYCLHTALTEP